MTRYRLSRALMSTTAVMALFVASGCDDYRVPTLSTSDVTASSLEGSWRVVAYGADETGCKPRPTTAPIGQVIVDSKTSDDGDEQPAQEKLEMVLCADDGTCSPRGAPENQLVWNGEYQRAERIYHAAHIHQIGPLEYRCRLSATQTLAVADGTQFQITRSFFETALPMDGDEACNTELAVEYRAQMPCVHSETFRLTAQQEHADDS